MNKKNRNFILLQVVLLICLLPGMSIPAAAEQGPVEMLRETTDRIMRIIEEDPGVLEDQARLRVIASDIIFPHVDFVTLSRWVLGKHWRQATPAQREIFTNEFRELLLNTYLRSVTGYRDNKIHYQPLRQVPTDGKAVVHAHVETPGSPTVKADFRLLQKGQEWLIYDVAIDGVSLVTTHRSSFSELIRRNGIAGVIAQLEARNAKIREDTSSAPEEAFPQ